MTMPNLIPLTDGQSALVAEYLPLAKRFASIAHAKKQGMNRDDLFDAAVDGLISASRRYDPATGNKFATYAAYRVKGSIQDFIRDLLGFRLKIPAPKIISVESLLDWFDLDETSDDLFADLNTVDPLDTLCEDEGVKGILRHLAPRYRALALMCFHGLTLRECGAMLGLAESRISQIIIMLQKNLRDNPPSGMEAIIERMRGARRANRGGIHSDGQTIDLEEFAKKFGLAPPKEKNLRPTAWKKKRDRKVKMKFTDDQVAVIKGRRLRGEDCEALAKEYDTTVPTIYSMCNGRTYAYRNIEPVDLSQAESA